MNLQKRLISIYNLTRKEIPFQWKEEHQKTYEEIKNGILNPVVVIMTNNSQHFALVSDTNGVLCGEASYQVQKGKLRLGGYSSKKLPRATIKQSIGELELCGLAVSTYSFKCILGNTKFMVI